MARGLAPCKHIQTNNVFVSICHKLGVFSFPGRSRRSILCFQYPLKLKLHYYEAILQQALLEKCFKIILWMTPLRYPGRQVGILQMDKRRISRKTWQTAGKRQRGPKRGSLCLFAIPEHPASGPKSRQCTPSTRQPRAASPLQEPSGSMLPGLQVKFYYTDGLNNGSRAAQPHGPHLPFKKPSPVLSLWSWPSDLENAFWDRESPIFSCQSSWDICGCTRSGGPTS